ncbi:MAG: SDR family oxidoreductase [Candidatus Promineofilum sp.]|nr:SDR family oxidoreductase [Promineifilum sp.]
MRVLVTGHNGYVGTVLVPMLLKSGHDVVGLDTNLYQAATFGDEDAANAVPAINKDVRDVTHADIDGFDAILHLAGLSNDPLGDLNPELTYEINHQASLRLAEIAKEVGVERYIFSSSCSNYGAGVDDWLTEESAFNPVTPYGRSKVMVEQDVAKLADDTFSPTFLRSSTAYGVSPRLRFDLVINNLTAWAYTTGLVYLKSDGTPWRPVVHIEDMSLAFVAALNAPRELIHNEAFNVGRPEENYRIRELAEIVAEVVPNSRVEFAEGASADKRNYRVDSSKIARTLPEFKPQWTARKGAQELYEAYQRVGLQLEEFEGPRYRRIDHIKMLMSEGRLDDRLRWRTTVPA